MRCQISDIDSKQMVIHIRQGKGRIPRDIVLSPVLLERLRIYCCRYKPRLWLFPSERRSDGLLDQRTIRYLCRNAGGEEFLLVLTKDIGDFKSMLH